METLIDRCREAKKAQNMSNQKVSELSNVPLSTVNNFFRSGQRSPSIDTVGPICAAIGVSIDDYYNVPKKQQEIPDTTLLREMIDTEKVGIKVRDRIIFILLAVIVLLIICLII